MKGTTDIRPMLFDKFSTSSTYDIGDYVFYFDKLYKCKVPVVNPGAFSDANWDQATISNELILVSEYVNEVQISTNSTSGSDASVSYSVLHYNRSDNNSTVLTPATVVLHNQPAVNLPNTINLGGLAYLTYYGHDGLWRVVALKTVSDGTNTFNSGDIIREWPWMTNMAITIQLISRAAQSN